QSLTLRSLLSCIPLFYTAPATSDTYTLSLHDALPILCRPGQAHVEQRDKALAASQYLCLFSALLEQSQCFVQHIWSTILKTWWLDRKSTRLNSSHQIISYAVFCLKKKKTITDESRMRH